MELARTLEERGFQSVWAPEHSHIPLSRKTPFPGGGDLRRGPPPPGGPRFGQPGRPTREWSGRLAQTRGQDRRDYVRHGRGRPSVGETPANMVDVFLASAAPLARDSGCPPNRVNPSPKRRCTERYYGIAIATVDVAAVPILQPQRRR